MCVCVYFVGLSSCHLINLIFYKKNALQSVQGLNSRGLQRYHFVGENNPNGAPYILEDLTHKIEVQHLQKKGQLGSRQI